MGSDPTTSVLRGPTWPIPVLTIVAVAYVALLASGTRIVNYNLWGLLAVAPVLTAATWAIARSIAARTADPTVVRLVLGGWSLKMIGSVVRWWTAFGLYDKADARAYDRAATGVAEVLHRGSVDFSGLGLRGGETEVIEIASGVVYAFTGPSSLAGFLVFAWFAFMGVVLLWRGFVMAVPDGDSRRYALLLVVLPSIVYWPSSLGKDAWLLFSLGLGAYGAARLLSGRPGGLVLLTTGLAIGSLVRVHVMLLLVVATAAAWLLGRLPRPDRPNRSLRRLGGAVALVGVCILAFGQFGDAFDVASPAGVSELLEETSDRTAQGGSEFGAVRINAPVDLPWAAVTVLVRPFPFEADNLPALGASLEGLLLVALLAVSHRRIVRALRHVRAQPYLLLCAVFVIGFVIAFSTIGNFGILARQRVQVLPFLLVFVCARTSARNHERPPVAVVWRRCV